MQQNIYDNLEFYAGYKAMRNSSSELNQVLEQPAIKSLLSPCADKSVLELGCGSGHFCTYLIEQGADRVVGVDISKKMVEDAKSRITDKRITFIKSSIENFDAGSDKYDIVVSSLAFHYIADLDAVFKKIGIYLKPSGCLVFSMEHPIITCSQGIHPGWHENDAGERAHWAVDAYAYEGIRESHWFVDGVVRYHRQLSSVLNSLVANGFCIEQLLEPHALEEAEKRLPFLLEERRRPPFLVIRAEKLSKADMDK